MTELPDNILHLPQYQVLGCKSTDDEMHFQVDVPDPIACEECGVQGEFVRFFSQRRQLPSHADGSVPVLQASDGLAQDGDEISQ